MSNLLLEELERLRAACSKEDDEICQLLGKVLGYPWYKDDQDNFPGATEENGVCVGDHVAITLAMEAVKEIERLRRVMAKDPKVLMIAYENGRNGELARALFDAMEKNDRLEERINELQSQLDSRIYEIKDWNR